MAHTALPKFGEVGISLGFIHQKHIRQALQIQVYRRARGLPIPLLGEALVEMGAITQEQSEEIFNSLVSKSQAAKGAKRSWWARLRGA